MDIIKLRDRIRRKEAKKFAGLSDGDIKRIQDKIDVVECLACGNMFVSLDKRKIRRCDACAKTAGARPVAYDGMEMRSLVIPGNKRRSHL